MSDGPTKPRRKVALYARVSTVDKQDSGVQFMRLREFTQSHGDEVFKEYEDKASGSNSDRPSLVEMMNDAKNHRFSAILIVRLDRITRSLINLLHLLEKLDAYKVSLICTDQPIETETPSGRLLIQILGALAEFERELIRDRVKDGMAKAKADGKHVGRPILTLTPAEVDHIVDSRKEGHSWSEIAKTLNIPASTVRKAYAQRVGGKTTHEK